MADGDAKRSHVRIAAAILAALLVAAAVFTYLSYTAAFTSTAGVNQVVGASEQLIQVGGETPAAGILARGGEVGRGLAVQLRQLAQVIGRERADVASLACRDERFEPRPVRFPFLHPVHGESR